MKVGHKVLGMAVGQKSILLAEVSAKGERVAVTNVGEFIFPEGLSLSNPEKLGAALAQFLKSKRFGTKDVVIGLPAKRLVTRRKEVPAASPAMAASTLRLQAEGEFSSELDNLIMDYAGSTSASEPTTVLLVATNKVVVDECAELARVAGLRVHGITSTGAALGRATSRLPGGDGMVLNLGSNAAELVVQHGADAAHLRHLNVAGGAESIGILAGEIRRTMASIPQNGTPQTLAVWNTGGGENPQSILEQRLSMPVTTPELRTLVATDAPGAEGFAPAAALALTAMEPAGLPVDFLHSRLAAPKEPGLSLLKQAGIAAGVLFVAAIVAGYVVLSGKSTELNQIQSQLDKQKPVVKQADADIKRYLDAEKWIPKGPRFVAVLKDLTNVFPPQGQTIWATRLQPLRNNQWELQGQAASDQQAGELVRRMLNDTEHFSNPKTQRNNPGAGNSRLYEFTILFDHLEQ